MTIYDLLRSSVVQIRSDAVSSPFDAVSYTSDAVISHTGSSLLSIFR